MAVFLLIALTVLTFAIVVQAIIDPVRIYQYPFCAAVVIVGFIVPPLFGLLRASYLPPWSIERYLFTCILCLVMCWAGDACAKRYSRPRARLVVYDARRWLLGSTLLILVGGLTYLKSRILFQAEFNMGTGLPTALSFFTVLLRYGFIMAMIYLLSTRNKYALLLAGLSGLYYLDRIILFGRRQDAFEFLFVIIGAVWFVLGKRLPRIAIVAMIVVGAIAATSVGAYRSIVVSTSGERDWSRLRDVNVLEGFRSSVAEGSTETLAGVYLMAASAAENAFDFGAYHWNVLVFNYVPAQVFGADFKESLYIPAPDLIAMAERRYGFVPSSGTTVTGMVDCYASFWYAGCLKFFLIAYIMQWLYLHAIRGSLMAQSIYLFMMGMALHAVTHHTQFFFSPWLHLLFFWVPVMFIAARSVEPVELEAVSLAR